MVGQLHLYANSRAYEDKEEEDVYQYRYSAFHAVKGDILRASIAYLKSAKSDAVSNPKAARQTLIDAGLADMTGYADNAEALTHGIQVIDAAVGVLQGWVREPVGEGSMLAGDWTGGAVGRNAPIPPTIGGHLAGIWNQLSDLETMRETMKRRDMGALLNENYHSKKVSELSQCPLALSRVGMRGMYYYMRLPDNGAVIYADEAALIASALTRVVGSMPDDDDGTKDYGEQMKDFFSQCVGEMIIIG